MVERLQSSNIILEHIIETKLHSLNNCNLRTYNWNKIAFFERLKSSNIIFENIIGTKLHSSNDCKLRTYNWNKNFFSNNHTVGIMKTKFKQPHKIAHLLYSLSDNFGKKSPHGIPIIKKIYLSNLIKLLHFFILFEGE